MKDVRISKTGANTASYNQTTDIFFTTSRGQIDTKSLLQASSEQLNQQSRDSFWLSTFLLCAVRFSHGFIALCRS